MSERLLKIALSELVTIRVLCKKCQATIEMSIDNLSKVLSSGDCPMCKSPLQPPNDNDFPLLAKAIHGIKAMHKAVDVQFVIPAGD